MLSFLMLLSTASAADLPYRPVRQHLSLRLDPSADGYTGHTEILLDQIDVIEKVRLHAAEMEITKAVFTSSSGRVQATVTPIGHEQVEIVPNRALKYAGGMVAKRPGHKKRGDDPYAVASWWYLELTFENDYNDTAFGLYTFESEGQPYLITQFEADDAREAFPCFDEPHDKVDLWLELEVPEALTALSNAPILDETVENGWKTVSFAPTTPIPTYAMAIAVGPYEARDIDLPIPGQVWTVAGQTGLADELAARIPPSLEALQQWFGEPYAYQKLDWVAVPRFAFGAMENPGLVISTDRLLSTPGEASPHQQSRVAEVVAHELAHMWFGDLVTLQWWDDFWLNESFATWLALEIRTELDPEQRGELDAVRNTQRAIRMDGQATMLPVRVEVDPENIFQSLNFMAYGKGQAILDTVAHWIGPEAFQAGVRAYIDAHRGENATSADLFAALSEASGEDIAAMLGPYLDAPGAPLVRIAVEGAQLSLDQERFALLGAEVASDTVWTIPLTVRYADASGVHTHTVRFDSRQASATLPAEGEVAWILPKADGVGYYLWELDETELAKLLSNQSALSAAERLSVIGNLDLLVSAGRLDAGRALALVDAFAADTDLEIISRVSRFQERIADAVPEALDEAWTHYRRTTARPWLDGIGLDPVDGESPDASSLRLQLLALLAAEGGDPEVRTHVVALGQAFLDDPAAVDPQLGRLGLRVHAQIGTPALQETLLDKYRSADNPQLRATYLSAAVQVPDEAGRAALMDLALTDDVSDNDRYTLLFGALYDDDGEPTDDALDWTMAHYDALVARLPPVRQPSLVGVISGCDPERFARGEAFFAGKDVPGMHRALDETREDVALCVASREHHQESVVAFLEALIAAQELSPPE